MRKKKWNFTISSGGTRVPIDYVRFLTNASKGTTGALLTRAALERGHNVDYVHAPNARMPFERDLRVNLENDIEVELNRLRHAMERIRAFPGKLTNHLVEDFFVYREKLLELVHRPDMDVAILAMAASDYGPKKVEGKIPSNKEKLIMEFELLPKIISEVKKTREGIFLVGFKLLTEDAGEEQLLAKAFRSMDRDLQDLAVANIVDEHFKPKATFILTPERKVIEVFRREDLADMLLDKIEERKAA